MTWCAIAALRVERDFMTEDDIQKVSAFLAKHAAHSPISQRDLELYQYIMRHPDKPAKDLIKQAQQEMNIQGEGDKNELFKAASKLRIGIWKFDEIARKEGYTVPPLKSELSNYGLGDNNLARRAIHQMRFDSIKYIELYHDIFKRRDQNPAPKHVQLEMWMQGYLQCELTSGR
jgi:hypothetical protein